MQSHEPHDYRSPPPGQGSARDLICSKCGQRRSVAGHSECPGVDREVVTDNLHDYEPFE